MFNFCLVADISILKGDTAGGKEKFPVEVGEISLVQAFCETLLVCRHFRMYSKSKQVEIMGINTSRG
ncbi:hypothetical protein D3P08_04275 [Paenibacillus nanensis]|uniref:Uncharacterized protein n=1 Tax=Paenibacillus nanensis TaxID=393251 RepID=A0A3A1VFN3_9BACL|nr:hypothetical protein D3P08_04275 [Paenibacillus nanensis]